MIPVETLVLLKRTALVAAFGAVLAGCASDNVGTEKGPMATPQVVTVVPGVPQGAPATGPEKTGYYPGFSKPLTSAALQMTDEEAAAQQAQLTAQGGAKRRGTISEAEYKRREAEMRRLAKQHGQQTLDEIAR